ncbi:ATP-grasp domain-containing protein [Peribacillus butanolivorans]|uniref:ATP-grasp domain-containing protein n=1 Tax=Peribacillus butanolivorans TaxID=421767 RepID=UPI00167FD7FA|nr:RimK family alpha-L-glutamate ligase [Peribacillus butanolivorans]QNU03792.1 RimK family alpha-L-glutamate ligase [Peribacillus butanolivorans]
MKPSAFHCWIVVNGYLQHDKFSSLALFIKEAAERKEISATLVRNSELIPVIEKGLPMLKGNFEKLPDFVLFMDKDIHLARHLELLDIPVYNSSTAIDICDSKAKTHQALAGHGIPMPKTLFPPFTYEGIERINVDAFKDIGLELGYPLIVKEAYGSFGEQVYLIQSEAEFLKTVHKLGHKPFIIQEFIEHSKGRDIRVNVVGDQVIAAMHRKSEHDFRANMTVGGHALPYSPTKKEADLAIQCASILGADFAGVDLLFGEDGPLLCEVNSNSHLLNIYDCTGINIADSMFDYVLDKLEKGSISDEQTNRLVDL